MTERIEVNVPRLRQIQDVVNATGRFDIRAGRKTVRVRLDVLDPQSRVDPVAGSLLGWFLCTRARHWEIQVVVPRNEGLLRQLARVGFWFALAQRPGPTSLEVGDASEEGRLFDVPPEWAELQGWQGYWRPSEPEFRSRALGKVSDGTPSPWEVIQDEFIAFKNPHLGVERARLQREINENLAVHWVRRLVGEDGTKRDTGSASLIDATGTTLRELIYNFAVHPFTSLTTAPPLQRDVPKDRQIGYVALYVTKGGGEQSFDRLHIVVADCGHGIPATLRPKLPRSTNVEIRSDNELLKGLLEGSLPKYGRAEGRGLIRLVDLAAKHGGSLTILSGAQDGIAGTLVASGQMRGSSMQVEVNSIGNLDVDGTVVRMMLPLSAEDGKPLTLSDTKRT